MAGCIGDIDFNALIDNVYSNGKYFGIDKFTPNDFTDFLNEIRNASNDKINEENVENIISEIDLVINLYGTIRPDEFTNKLASDILLLKLDLSVKAKSTELTPIEDVKEAKYNLREKTFIDDYFGSSIASEYMLEMFTKDFIRNTLVDIASDDVSAPTNIGKINDNLETYLQRLYLDLKRYIEDDPNIHTVLMPDNLINEDGTNNFKAIFKQLEPIFGKDNISPETISRKYLSKEESDLRDFRALTDYFILKHFDQLILRDFKDFLNIGEIFYGKPVSREKIKTLKYTFNKDHDYLNSVSWLTDERSTPKDVMSHHLLYLMRTIPYIDLFGKQHGYLDTDVIIYSLKAVKDIYLKGKLKKDQPFTTFLGLKDLARKSGSNEIIYTKEEEKWIESLGNNVYISDVINSLRDNPQLGYSVLFKLLKSDYFKGNNSQVFNVDVFNIFDSLYNYVFKDNRLLNSTPDLYLELIHFLDFTTNLENTQYFSNNEGEWSIRTMNPMNIELNKYILQNSINSAHIAGLIDYLLSKYDVTYKTEENGLLLKNSEKYVLMLFKAKDSSYTDITYTVRYYPGNSGNLRVKIFKSYDGRFNRELNFINGVTRVDYDNFKEFIRDAIQINLANNKDLDTLILRSVNDNYGQALENLLGISASVLGNASIFRKESGLIKPQLDVYARRWGLHNGNDKDVLFSNKLGAYDIIGKSASHLITWLATNQGIARRLMTKSTTQTAEKTTISANSLTCLSSERRNQYRHYSDDSAVKLEMLSDILGWGNSREADLGVGGKLAHNFNFGELLYSNFAIDFLTGYKNANNTYVSRFKEAVNSDKGNSPIIEVARDLLFNSLGIPVSAKTFQDLHKETFSKIYLKSWENMYNDFEKLNLFAISNGIYEKLGFVEPIRIDVENNFLNFNLSAKSIKLTGNELLHKITLAYNEFNFNDPIAIIENVHKRGSGDIELNRAFIDNLMRFNSIETVNGLELSDSLEVLKPLRKKLKAADKTKYWESLLNLDNYFKLNELRLVDDLLTESAKLNIGTDEEATSGWRKILNSYEGWKDDNNNMVLAKLVLRVKDSESNAKTELNVTDITDLIGFYLVVEEDGVIKHITPDDPSFNFAGKLEHDYYEVDDIWVHPALRAWTAADGLYTGKSLTANVGLTVYSDPKRAKNTLYEEEGAVGDYVKRNVINTATMKLFTLNSLNGITENLKIAVIEDLKAELTNMVTDFAKYKVWDGATFTNAFLHYWENNSLSGSVTGFTKKPIMHHYFDKYAAGYLQKTASFAINNEKMRDSILFRAMHYKTSNIKWRSLDNLYIAHRVDITKDYRGNNISYDDCYYKSGGRYYKIKSILKVDYIKSGKDKKIAVKDLDNYEVIVQEVNDKGEEIKGIKAKELYYNINSNYTLWLVLGGYNSVSMNNETGKLEYSEKSIEKVAEVSNIVGDIKEGYNVDDVTTLLSIYLFMKHSNIHYIATEGAVKKGAANINKFNKNENSILNTEALNFFRVSARNFGILLDPTHEADNAEVSLMTQVISGLADRGFTSEAVNEVYSALGRLAREAVREDLENYKKVLGNDKNLESRVANEIASTFINELGNANHLIESIALKISKMKFEDDKYGIIPWSDPSIFKLISSSITSTLNKMAIRVKSFGSLSVLNPSHGTILLFNNKKLSEYSSALKLYLEGVKLNESSEYITNHKLYLGHWYMYEQRDGLQKRVQMNLDNYYKLTSDLDNGDIKWFKEILLGDEIEITGEERNKPLFGLFKLYLNEGDKNPLITYIDGNIKDPSKLLTVDPKKYHKIVKVEVLGRDLDTFNVFINNGENTLYDLKPVRERYDLRKRFENKEIDANTYKSESHRLIRDILREFNLVKEESEKSENDKVEVEFTNGNKKISNYETSAYGVLVPMIYKSKFGLKSSDNLSDIVNDEEFFFKRLLLNYADLNLENKRVSKSNYDVVIKNLNNHNIYLQTKLSNIENNNKLLQEIEVDIRQAPNGKFYRYDLYGNKMYEVSSKLDKVYIDHSNTNMGEVIVTDDAGIRFYIDRYAREPLDILINKKNKEKEFKKQINNILKETKLYKSLKKGNKKYLTYDSLSADDVDFINNYLENGMKESGMGDAIHTMPRFKKLWEKSLKIRTSFFLSCNFLAARIPAQSMQSFMKMKVEGFTNVGVNDCYISDMQVWLQGSDFDVDKVTLMGMALTNSGLLKPWSKYIRFQDEMEYAITSKIKFPTGLETKVVTTDSIEHHKYEKLFKNGELNIERPESPKFKTFENPDGTVSLEEEQKAYRLYDLEMNKYYSKLRLMVEMFNKYSNTLEGAEDNVRNNILKAVNDNNLQELRDIDEVLMNLVQYRAAEISGDISNLIASLNPIDVVALPLKDRADRSNFGRKDMYNRYGNSVVKDKLLLNNQTGKTGIEVTAASGIKTFFALTLFFNNSLKNNLSLELLNNLKFNVKIRGKEYHTISNLNEIKLSDTVRRDPKLAKLVEAVDLFNEYIRESDPVDADAVISAIMTLATDNAKELKLGKLNASAEILGLYLYGVTIGVPFDTLADIFTSNTADVLNKRMHGNIFTDEGDISLARAITWLLKGPSQPMEKVGSGDNVEYIPHEDIQEFLNCSYYNKPSTDGYEKSIVLIIKNIKENISKDTPINDDMSPGQKSLQLTRRKALFADLIKYLLNQAQMINSTNWKVSRYRNEVIDYISSMYKIYGDGNFERNDIADIKQLLDGSREIGTLRSLILNKGVPVLLEDKLSFYDNFSTIIQNTLPKKTTVDLVKDLRLIDFYNVNNTFKIDFELYCTDLEYKQKVIDAYEANKHTINPFRVVDGLPHYKEYLNVAAADSMRLSLSSVFRAIRSNSNFIFDTYEVYGGKDVKRRYYKRMEDFFTRKLQDSFLRGITIRLDDNTLIKLGNKYVKSKGNPIVTLGTVEGNVAFKNWVESTLLLLLLAKDGYNVKGNTFVNDLMPKLYTRTMSGNRIKGLSLPQDMIPKTELEKKTFDRYQLDFLALTGQRLLTDSKYSIADILYLYNLVTYGNSRNVVALTGITDILYKHEGTVATKYRDYIAKFDSNNTIHVVKNFGDALVKDGDLVINLDELLRQVAPESFEIKRKADFRGPYVRLLNTLNGIRELWKIREEVVALDEAKLLARIDKFKSKNSELEGIEELEEVNDLDEGFGSPFAEEESLDIEEDVSLEYGGDIFGFESEFEEQNDVKFKLPRKDWMLGENYEEIVQPGQMVDRTALDILGRFVVADTGVVENIPEISSNEFSDYLNRQINNQVLVNVQDDMIPMSISYYHEGRRQEINAVVERSEAKDKFRITFDNNSTATIPTDTTTTIESGAFSTIDKIMLRKKISDYIRKKHNIEC